MQMRNFEGDEPSGDSDSDSDSVCEAGSEAGSDVAVIGMAGRFPGARNVAEFWRNIRDGVESIQTFAEADLDPPPGGRRSLSGSSHVPAGAVLDDIDYFDADFFDFTPREAEVMDPQHRIFLECAWEAMEDAGYYAEGFDGAIGVYAGSLLSTYLMNLYSNPDLLESVGAAQVGVGNNVDFLCTMLSYKLGLNGPSVTVQTACSTSLVAAHVACQALLNGECDMALAGGVAVRTPQRAGYYYQEGGILSPDGRCRAFDASAQGTVFGNGAGIVVLKRLADAMADGDAIRAVLKGSAINNDGSLKVGFTAPSVQGQTSVVVEALAAAGVNADAIGYVEAHGTGTALGDPIEVQALTEAFRVTTDRRGYCPIGSVKTNIGHLDAAAGVAGLIKAILALEHDVIPPSLHCATPNPKIDFASSPFFVNRELAAWKRGASPRRAGVSSLGIGGTNAHVIVEDPPAAAPSGPSGDWQLLALSGKTESALDAATENLAVYLKDHPQASLADVSYTLQVGRKPFGFRRALVCNDVAGAVRALESGDRERLMTAAVEPGFRPLVFMFSGQASQYEGMAADLYASEAYFRGEVDRCAALLRPHVDFDITRLLFSRGRTGKTAAPDLSGPEASAPAAAVQEAATPDVDQTSVAQPALFIVEYALARWMMRAGLKPEAMIGHSLGEYVAACLAGVISLDDALRLVAARGRLMQALDRGAMLAVRLPEDEARARLTEGLSLAAVNAPDSCVVSGPTDAVDKLQSMLTKSEIACQRLRASHAFHSAMMEPALAPFREVMESVTLNAPQIPYLSNVTGMWADEDVTNPEYWLTHLRGVVNFSAGISALVKDPKRIFLEVGPGQTLCDLVRGHRPGKDGAIAVPMMRHSRDRRSDVAHLAGALGKIWLAGGEVDWRGLHAGETRRRVPLPTYPFERRRFWVEAKPLTSGRSEADARIEKKPRMADWFYLPSWRRSLTPPRPAAGDAGDASAWLILTDAEGVGSRLARRLEKLGQRCVRVAPKGRTPGTTEGRTGDAGACDLEVDPASPSDWDALLRDLLQSGRKPRHVIHLWTLDSGDPERPGPGDATIDRGFYALLHLAQAMVRANLVDPVTVSLVANRLHNFSGDDPVAPEKAMALAPCLVIPQEHANIRCYSIDVEAPAPAGPDADALADLLLAEACADDRDPAVVYRGEARWRQVYEPVETPEAPDARLPLREGGTYLILGGLGRFGLVIARHLAERYRAKLVLTAQDPLPPREQWDAIVSNADEADRTARRLRRVMALEDLGAEVMTRPLKLTGAPEIKTLVDEVVDRFGALNGVVHAAGLQEHTPVLAATRDDCERVFAPKVQGLFALEEALRGREIDFCVFTSSLSPILGGLGFVAYAASNLFMDAFAQECRGRGAPWRTVNWEGWHRQEMSSEASDAAAGGFGNELAKLVMSDEEVVECFKRAMALQDTPRLIIATGDLKLRIDQWVRLEALAARRREKTEATSAAAGSPRRAPKRRGDVVAPRDEVEQTIVEVARAVLGMDDISVYDNFFEMGGSSLLAVQLISGLRDAFQQQLPLRALFDRPTIAGLAEVIREGLPRDEDMIELSSLLEEIETLDDDEVQRRLADAGAGPEET